MEATQRRRITLSLEKLMKKKPWLLIIIGAVALALILPNLQFPSLTVISISEVNIDPVGWEDPATHEWKGSFWIIAMTTDVAEQVAGLKLTNPTGEPGNTYIELDDGTKIYADDTLSTGEHVIPQSTITVRIDPDQPYWERPLEIQQVNLNPKTYGTWTNALGAWGQEGAEDSSCPATPAGYSSFGTGSWTQHTPFKVTVKKDGVTLDEQTIDTVGGTQIYRLPETGDEYVHITDLGKLQSGFGEPDFGDVLYFSDYEIFQADTYSRSIVEFDGTGSLIDTGWDGLKEQTGESYSTYWFGNYRWKEGGYPAALADQGGAAPSLVGDNEFGGWERRDDWSRNAVAPPVFVGDKPDGKENFKCLIEYLLDRGVSRTTLPSWLVKYEADLNNWLKLYMPYGAASSLVTIKISTELADTIVWQPLVGKFDITSFPNLGDIADSKTSSITISCSEGEGSGTITFTTEPADLPISINPPTIGTGSMVTGDLKTFNYEILNLGIEENTDGTITATVRNSLGTVTDTATATFRLLEKTGSLTVLTVKTVDKATERPVTGIAITVEYAEQTRSSITDAEGQGVTTFSLGSYSGAVKITSASTSVYRPREVTAQVLAGEQTVVVLELEKFDVIPPDMSWLIWVGVAVATISIVAVVLYKKRRRKQS